MIRHATPFDASAIAVLCGYFYRDHPVQGVVPFEMGHVLEQLRGLPLSPEAFVWVSETEELLTGFLIGILAPMTFNKSVRVASEVAWYIHPDYRKGRDGLALFKEFEKWAEEKGAKAIFMYSHGMYPGVSRLYERRGYVGQDTTFAKVL